MDAKVNPGAEVEPEPPQPISFIVRATVDSAGRVSGIVERVRTGEKQRFQDVEAIGPLIARMLTITAGEAVEPP